MHYKSGNIEIIARYNIDEIINDFIDLPVQRYQVGLEQSIINSKFVSHYVDGLHNKCH